MGFYGFDYASQCLIKSVLLCLFLAWKILLVTSENQNESWMGKVYFRKNETGQETEICPVFIPTGNGSDADGIIIDVHYILRKK